MTKLTMLSLFISTVAWAAFAAEPAALQGTVTETDVEVRNATPNGDVVLMTAQLEAHAGLLRQIGGATRASDADGDGIVRVTPVRPIPLRSIFVAVDLESGRYLIAGPEDYPLAVVPFPSHLLQSDADGVLGLADQEVVSAQVLVVRPKTGAWRLVASEGGDGDADQTSNGKLSLASFDALPVGGSGPAPKHLRKGDILAVIDPGRMEVSVTEIGK